MMNNKFFFIHLKAVPFMWVLMSRRKIPDYKGVFQFVKKNWVNMSPKVLISDFERGLHKAAKEVFKSLRLRGCFFHYSQVLLLFQK